MGLFRHLARAYAIDRMLGGGRRRHGRSRGYGYGYGYGRPRYAQRRQRGRVGFFGPFPYYSGRTRGGSRVSVGGCCLPIPLAMVLATAGAGAKLLRRG